MQPIDKDTNYRKYYEKDQAFHIRILEKEPGPYKFKMHMFRGRTEGAEGHSQITADDELELSQHLDKTYDATGFKCNLMDDKLKMTFDI